MSHFQVVQSDDPHRAISVQNPMSINDLMVTQPRRMSTSAIPPQQSGQNPYREQRTRRNRHAPSTNSLPPVEQEEPIDPEELGYDLILNERKKKKEEHHTSASSMPIDDELWHDEPQQPVDDYVDPGERQAFETQHGGVPARQAGPDLPPVSPHRPASTPRRLSVRRPGVYGDRMGMPPPQFYQQPKPYTFGDIPYEEMMEKKQKYLEGLDKFRRRGMNVKGFDADSPLEEIEMEYNRHKRSVDVEASIQFSRKMLMACVTGLEYINSRYDPLGLQLDGWSESVIEDIHNYDDVFERLYDKYHTSVQMAPEFELLLMVAGSAFMFHLTNSMFKSAMPGMANPDMMRNVRRGVMGAMSGAMSGAAGGGGVSGMMSGMFGGGQQQQPRAAAPPPPRPNPKRREMRPPSNNMDDLLNNLMDREPGEVSERLVDEIDDILNTPSDDEQPGNTPARSIRISASTGPGGSVALPRNPPIDI